MKISPKLILGVLLVSLTSCECERSVEISGTVLESCANPIPVEGAVLTYYSHSEGQLFDTTGADGKFRFSMIEEPGLGYSNNSLSLLKDDTSDIPIGHRFLQTTQLGDIYLDHRVQFQFLLNGLSDSVGFSEKAELHIKPAFTDDEWVINGPFYNSMILEEVTLNLPPHTGYLAQDGNFYIIGQLENIGDSTAFYRAVLPLNHENIDCNEQAYTTILEFVN
ncbi:hypothetical protein GCM10011318_21860 [Phaeocystidibacter marisrubri]|nr:hypothetical protein GCM10011318_21860 [Phaeocystidibacter marisrubri]